MCPEPTATPNIERKNTPERHLPVRLPIEPLYFGADAG
jgi:hypothetical protein